MRKALGVVGTLALVALAGWGFYTEQAARSGSRTIVVGSKDSSEPILLARMIEQLVEAHTDIHVAVRPNLGGTLVCYNALRQGGLDLYVEYTGTALTTILKEPPRNDPGKVLARVREVCAERDGVRVLDAARIR